MRLAVVELYTAAARDFRVPIGTQLAAGAEFHTVLATQRSPRGVLALTAPASPARDAFLAKPGWALLAGLAVCLALVVWPPFVDLGTTYLAGVVAAGAPLWARDVVLWWFHRKLQEVLDG